MSQVAVPHAPVDGPGAAAVLGFLEEVVASERAEAATEVARAEDR